MSKLKTSPTSRVGFFDNARFWLIILVVMGHFLAQIHREVPGGREVYIWLFLFHMPAFILITGYVTRNFTFTKKNLVKTFWMILVPYIVFETATQALFYHYGVYDSIEPWTPRWLGWFLIAMVWWRLLTPLFKRIPHPIIVSIIISLSSGLIEVDPFLGLSKVTAFLPFYVIGLHLNKDHFEKLHRPRIRVASVALLTLALILVWSIPQSWDMDWIKWKRSYEFFNVSLTEGLLTRAILIVTGLILTAAFLSLCSWATSWYTSWGTRSLYAYILHGYILIILKYQYDFWTTVKDYPSLVGWLIVALSGLLAIGLMAKPISKYTRWLVNPSPR